jgi:uncharacterized protein YndB with AHSA1/START domain
MTPIEPIRKSITVSASPEYAFEMFTAEHDSWWPRTHHIGKSPMTKGTIECRQGGRCYSEHEDGAQCDWGKVLVWEPPTRLVLAWQITHEWGYNPDLSQASEVEVRFTPLDGGQTRVDLEHRYLERMGPAGESARNALDRGWPGLLGLYAQRCSLAGGKGRD